jgi:diguanylate cyclase (GGDEF)-like protein
MRPAAGADTEVMVAALASATGPGANDPRRAATHVAYRLVEAVQTPDFVRARIDVEEELDRAARNGWREVELVLLYARAVDAATNDQDRVDAAVHDLVQAADAEHDDAMLAAGLGMRAELALRHGDVVGFGRDASRAVVLLERDGEPMARASGLVSVGVAYEALNLWELGDELYTAAESLLPRCDDPVLEPVLTCNRALTWFWWTAALLEVGEVEAARAVHATGAARVEHLASMPDSWAREVRVSLLARRVILDEAEPGDEHALEEMLAELGDPEWLSRVQVHLALAHLRLRADRTDLARHEARQALELATAHGTTYQRSFAGWTASLVETQRDPTRGTATRAYATSLARQRWEERLGRLVAAREQIHGQRLRDEHENLVRRTLEDPLTGLGNRRALDERLVVLRTTVASTTPVAMLIVDVDRFKRVNDAYGHETGDHVLRRIGAIVASVLRPEDLAVRFGGDEFAALIAGAPAEAVRARADRIGQLVHAEDWAALRIDLRVSVSVGVASGIGPGDLEGLYARADQALYAAKADGRGLLRVAT